MAIIRNNTTLVREDLNFINFAYSYIIEIRFWIRRQSQLLFCKLNGKAMKDNNQLVLSKSHFMVFRIVEWIFSRLHIRKIIFIGITICAMVKG